MSITALTIRGSNFAIFNFIHPLLFRYSLKICVISKHNNASDKKKSARLQSIPCCEAIMLNMICNKA